MTAPQIFGGNVACNHKWNELADGVRSCCLCGAVSVPDPDLDAHIGAALEEAAGLCRILEEIPQLRAIGSTIHYDLADDIRAIRPDAMQALERVRREARLDGMRVALEAIPSGWAGRPYCSNMDYGPNVSSRAKLAIQDLISKMEVEKK